MGALNYNLKKLHHPDPNKRAELLESNFTSLDSKMVHKELKIVRSLKPNLNRYVYHTSLNFSKEDKLDNAKILTIAQDYLKESGYTNNQYLIFRHYDADHPHIHLLVNRITFDGEVVSDSNNYRRSEAILRKLEAQYNLVTVAQSSYSATKLHSSVSQKAPTKEELEMIIRTGKPSEKMLLQELMSDILKQRHTTLQELIKTGEQAGISFLFNQASTGRVTGITYFHNGFKIKGQVLGNKYKWAEIIKKVDYEQNRDSKAISEANNSTTAKYGKQTARGPGISLVPENTGKDPYKLGATETADGTFIAEDEQSGNENGKHEQELSETFPEASILDNHDNDSHHSRVIGIQLSDDEDDAKTKRRMRKR